MQNSDKKKLSTEPYKGVRDFYPEDMFLQNYILETMRTAVESFGFSEYSASILEPAELYEAKSGEEIVHEQTYTFTDRGDRRVTLRPEMTPSVARLVAARKRDLAFPLRWYSIPNVFRYERPQRGRLREHFQLNCDIFGVPNIEADIEIISLASAIMRAFGAEDTEFEIRMSNRRTLKEIFNKYNLTEEETIRAYKLLDKKDKIDDFDEQMQKLLGKKLSLSDAPDNESALVIEKLTERGISNIRFDPSIVRGFDYYTGIVFEVFDRSPENNRSLFGGGRYDNLLKIFDVDDIPAIGFGMGDVTLQDFLKTHALLPHYVPTTDLYIATQSTEFIEYGEALAEKLRVEGINVAVNLLDKKLSDQIKTAGKQSIPFFLVVGENEITTKMYSVKNLNTGKEYSAAESHIAEIIWSDVEGE